MSVAGSRSGSPDETATPEGTPALVLKALARDDPNAVVASLDGQLHHGRPGSPAALRQQVGEKLAAALISQPGRLNRWIEALSTSPSPTGRQVACLLLASRYPQDREGVLRAAETLADDPHWEVREEAGGLLGTLLDQDFERVKSRLEAFRSSRSDNIRRAVGTPPSNARAAGNSCQSGSGSGCIAVPTADWWKTAISTPPKTSTGSA